LAYYGDHVRVYGFDSDNDEWVQLGADIDGEAYDQYFVPVYYATDISSDGSIVAVGVPLLNNETTCDGGQVRVYKYNGSTWDQVGGDINAEDDCDSFGL